MKLRSLFLASALLLSSALPYAQTSEPNTDSTWWKHAVIYEIYPRSFQDTNGDGIGDLNGITKHLDYLQALGVDAIWISPMFPSPQVDFGYDISNYRGVDPQYGTMADMERLIAEAKKRNIRIILDFVLNHTSDKHPWFIESASSKTNPKRDWYIWRDGKTVDGKTVPPSNWVSIFGGSAWEYDSKTKQYYYHAFYRQQPDLNWRNPKVENAMFDNMRFWMDKGVAGFRLDAVPELFETVELKDEPYSGKMNEYGDKATHRIYTNNLPEVHDTMRRMRKVVDSYNDGRVLIGETYLPNIAEMNKWYGGAAHNELQLPMDMLVGFSSRKLDAATFRKNLNDVETGIHGNQPLLVFDNHDNDRSFTRYSDGQHDAQIAKMLAAILFTTRSTALMYYGQELGMVNDPPKRKEDVRDPNGIHGWPKEKGRDGERKPMQWDNSAQAGFSSNSNTWLPVTPDYTAVNVRTELADPNSLLNWYKHLIALRRDNEALRTGNMTMINTDDKNVLAWLRQSPGGKTVVVALNMSPQQQKIILQLPKSFLKLNVLATNDAALEKATGATLTLSPYASFVAEVE